MTRIVRTKKNSPKKNKDSSYPNRHLYRDDYRALYY